jgi:hypothetical protein
MQMAKAVKKTATKKKAVKSDRPAQIVVTMPQNLKDAVTAKCEATGVPAARAIRAMLEGWVRKAAATETATPPAAPDAAAEAAA